MVRAFADGVMGRRIDPSWGGPIELFLSKKNSNVETKEKCFGNNKNVLFLNLNDKIIEQEKNKMAIHTHVIFRP